MIYADNAATTRLDRNAFEAMQPWLLEEYGNASQPYSFSRKPREALAEARALIAECIHAKPGEIFFTSGGTESDNWALKGLTARNRYRRAIITSAFEHHAVLHACEAIERAGYPVAYLWPDEKGVISVDALKSYITDETFMVSVMFANNEIGTIQPIKELCDVAHQHKALFHTDAVQAVGHVPVDVRELGVDMLSASAHKFNGPKGIGFLYVREGTQVLPFMDGGAQENGLRAGTENVAQIVGMATALKENCERMAENKRHIERIEEIFLQAMDSSGISYKRNGTHQVPGLLSLSFPNQDGEAILHRLDLHKICISTGSACDSVRTEISHVLKAIQLDETFAKGTIRISFGTDNTKEDANIIASELIQIVK